MDEQTQQQGKKRRGCLFYAFIFGSILSIFLVLGVLAGLKSTLAFFDKTAVPVPTSKMSPQDIAKVRERVDAFRQAVRAHESPVPLTLTADEVNALIKGDPDLEPLRDKVYVADMQGDSIKAQVSVSLGELGAVKFKDRYFNGFVTIKPTLNSGTLRLKPQKVVTLRGRAVPDKYVEVIQNVNFAKGLNKEPRVSAALDWIQSIEVKDGKLVIVPKSRSP